MAVRPDVPNRVRPGWPGRIIYWLALLAALAAMAHAVRLVVELGVTAFDVAGWHRADFLLVSAWPAVVLACLFVVAHHLGRRRRPRECGLWIAWAVLVLGLLIVVPRGVYTAGWYLLPVHVLLVTCAFGPLAGIGQAAAVVFAILLSAVLTAPLVHEYVPGVFSVVGFAGVATVSMALLGSLLHRTLDLAISAEEDQNVRMDEARKALRHRENLLRHAMRVETVGEMASMIVHQLRNQFQLIMGYATLGSRNSDAETAARFDAIVQTLGRSNDLLEGLLGMSRSDSGRVEHVDLAELCRQVCESYRRVLPATIDLQLDAPDHPVPVHLNPQGLEHALLNLMINARQSIDGDGVVRLRVSSDGGIARLEVADTGSGIPEEVLGEIFKPFFTTKKRGEGTGLGLAAVQRFVVASRGDVEVHSRIGEGTEFVLSFPMADRDAATA